MGAKPYTPKLHKLGQCINAWHLVIKKKHGKNISSSLLRRVTRRCNLPATKYLSINDCVKLRSHAFKEYYDYAKDADTHRDDFYELLAEAQAEAGNISKSNALRQQKLNEDSRITHQRIKIVTKDHMGASYQMEISLHNKTFLSADREQLESALIQENEYKYRLAYSSPFLHEPLFSEFGHMALNNNAQAVLDGTYQCPPTLHKYTKQFISHLEMDKCVRKAGTNPVTFTTSQSNAFWKRMTEKTSSSPSLKHIGTYKAAALTSIPYEIRKPLPRSKQCINVSLEKKGKGRKPSDMRTIWLIEADFNAGAKIHFVKRIMNNTALSNGLIPDSQYAKKHSRSIEAAIVKVLFFDLLQQTRSPGIFFASDLHQCFDRMAHPVCSLVMQRLGVDKNVIKCMLTAIQEMRHVVQTGYGDSSASYGNYMDSPLQGGGQDILLAALHDEETIDDVMVRAKKAAKVWNHSVKASGGAMGVDKCYWSAVDFVWNSGRWTYRDMDDIDDQAREGLGLYVCPDGSWTLQLDELHKKVTKWGTRIKHSSLTPKECYVSATTAMFKTILHSLPACSFTRKECKQLEVILYDFLLPKLGLSRKFPIVYRFAPHKFQGLGLLQIYVHIIIEKLEFFLRHMTQKTQLGLSFQASVETIQVEVGSSAQFFSLGFHTYGFLTPISWMSTLWEGVSWYTLQLTPGKWSLQPPHINDMSLMDSLIQNRSFTKEEIMSVNRCRLYLRVFFLSDIVSYDGTSIRQDAYDGWCSDQWISRWKWPRQPRPSPKDWRLWHTAIRDVWVRSETLDLQQPLSNWVNDTHLRFKYRSSEDGSYIQEKLSKHSFRYYEKLYHSTRHTFYYTVIDYKPTRTSFPVPIWATIVNDSSIKVICRSEPIIPFIRSIPTTWEIYLCSLDPNIIYLLRYSNFNASASALAESILSSHAIAVVDVSMKVVKRTSAVAWIITDRERSFTCEGVSGCPRFHAAIDSYRGELFGLLVVLLVANLICDYHNVQTGMLAVACDNDASLSKALDSVSRAKVTDPYFNIIWAAHEFRNTINITFRSKRVKGHQDDNKTKKLNFYERLNVAMDKTAKRFRSQLDEKPHLHRPWIFGDSNWHVGASETHFSYDLEQSIRDHIQGSYLKKHLIQNRISYQ